MAAISRGETAEFDPLQPVMLQDSGPSRTLAELAKAVGRSVPLH